VPKTKKNAKKKKKTNKQKVAIKTLIKRKISVDLNKIKVNLTNVKNDVEKPK
jgi:hypothetical protein